MKFTQTSLPGAFIVDTDKVSDERGFFGRTYCATTFREQGLNCEVAQCSVSYNAKRGTLRGMHFQAAPYAEDKLVRCTAGAIFDVIVDIRPESATYARWFGVELSEDNHRALYVPKGFAHGFITLKDHTEVFYMISVEYVPSHSRGFIWSDPAVGIKWPITPSIISSRDAALPLLADLFKS